jgi:predicted RND superfamily exporter protein
MNFFNLRKYFIVHIRLISVLTLSILCLTSVCGIFILRKLNTEYSISQFLDQKNALLVAEFKVKDDFSLPQWPYIYANVMLKSNETGTLLLPGRVSALRAASEEVASFPGIRRVTSIANVEGASTTKEGLTVGKILELTRSEKWASRVLGDPLLAPTLISKDGRTSLVAIEIEDLDTKALNSLPEKIRTAFQKNFPNSSISIGGIPAIQSEMAILLRSELAHFVLLALLACLLTLGAFFKDKASIFVPVLLVGFANIVSLAWMAWAKIPFTVLSTTLPVLVSIIVLSISTHTMINFAGNWDQATRSETNPDKIEVLFKTLRSLFLPNFLTALTTSLGFAALLTTKVPIIKDYAGCVAVGVMVAWACVMLALPPILVLMNIPHPRSYTASKARWALHLERNKKRIVLSVAVLALVLGWNAKGLNWTAKLFDDLPSEQEARKTSEMIDEKLGAIIPLDIVIHAKEADAWNDPDRIKKLSELLVKFRATSGVGSVMGISDLIAAGSRAQNQPLPTTRAGIAEMVFLYSLSPDRVTNQFLTSDGSQTRISVRVRDIPGNKMKALVDTLRVDTEAAFPGMEVQTVGMAANVHIINDQLCRDLIYGFWQAIFLISLVLLFIFRSVKWTLVAMLPNLISPITLMGVMAITNTAIKPGIALIFSIALGIAYNNTVYLLGRVRLLKQKSESRGESSNHLQVIKAWYQEGNPCVFSTLALVGGFAIFMASYFQLNRVFGAYMLLSIVAGMLGDLIFLPALLSWFPRMLENGKKILPLPRIQ